MGGVSFSFKFHGSTSTSMQQCSQCLISYFWLISYIINGDQRNISDLKVQLGGGAWSSNIDTTCFWSLKKLNYLPLIRLGLICHLVEILYFMSSSLWNSSFVLELHFHWILGEFIIHKHVVYHVLPLCNITWKLQIMTIFVQRTHYIPFDQFHDEL